MKPRVIPGTRRTMTTTSGAARAWWTTCVPLLLWLLPELARLSAGARHWGFMHRILRSWATLTCLALGVRLRTSGLRHARGGPFVVVALHEGMADATVLLRALPLDLRFVVRDELLSWPHVGRFLRDTRQLVAPPHRSFGAGARFLEDARAAIGRRESLVVFAQGSILGLEIALEPGAARLAQRLGVPILPIMVSGTHRIWEHPYSPRIRFGQAVRLSVLPPLESPGRANTAVTDLTQRLSRDLKACAPRHGPASVRRYEPDRDGWWDGYRFSIDPAFPALAARVASHRRASAHAPTG